MTILSPFFTAEGDQRNSNTDDDRDNPSDLKLVCERFVISYFLFSGIDFVLSRIKDRPVSDCFCNGVQAEEGLALADLAFGT